MSRDRPVMPPPPAEMQGGSAAETSAATQSKSVKRARSWLHPTKPDAKQAAKPAPKANSGKPEKSAAKPVAKSKPARPAPLARSGPGRTRTAYLRLTRIDPLSVMKMAFLLSIALGIVLVVAVTIIWSVLSAVGVWDNINSAVQQVIGTGQGENFDVSKYVGTPRVIGFALIASVINVVLLTAIATLAAFVYNLAAALLGGVEMTWSEDR